MTDHFTLAGIASTLFAALVVGSICVGILLTMSGAVLLTVPPACSADARSLQWLALALIAFGLAGFLWGACALPRLIL